MEETLEQPLHETKTVYTWEEYYSSSMAFSKKNLRIITISSSLIAGLLILVTLSNASRTGELTVFNLIFGVTMILFIILHRILFVGQLKKSWSSNQMVQNSENEFKFFTNHMEVTSPTGKSNFEYKQLHKIMETNRQFLLQPSNSQFYMVVKDNCTLELQKFLREIAAEVNRKK